MESMNVTEHIPAAHLLTVVNALHESACASFGRALDADAAAERPTVANATSPALVSRRRELETQARAARKVGRERMAAFRAIMRTAEIVDGMHRCGIYNLPADPTECPPLPPEEGEERR